MKKSYTKPEIHIIDINCEHICYPSSSHGNPHEGWLNQNGEPWHPGDGKPIKPAAEYRNNLWDCD